MKASQAMTPLGVFLTHAAPDPRPQSPPIARGGKLKGKVLIAVLGLFPRPGTAFGGVSKAAGENCRTPDAPLTAIQPTPLPHPDKFPTVLAQLESWLARCHQQEIGISGITR
jgi:hypothetical protein